MQLETIGAVILIGTSGSTRQEQLVHQAVRASVLDLLDVLNAQGVMPVVLAGPYLDWVPQRPNLICDLDEVPFHFGQRLAGDRTLRSVACHVFWGGSALCNQDMGVNAGCSISRVCVRRTDSRISPDQ
jgi:hypothetical protein